MTVIEKFWSKVNKTDGCWLWIGCTSKQGYGQFSVCRSKLVVAHRFSFELANGSIDRSLVIDHVCRVRNCVNPAHLRQVTHVQNVLENSLSLPALNLLKTHCKRGHEFTEANTYPVPGGGRNCRTCRNIASQRFLQKRKTYA